MGRKAYQTIIIILCCFFASCKKDKPDSYGLATSGGSGFVVCEGNFGNGDASLYVIDVIKDSIFGDIFSQANNQPLGDVFQSMIEIDSHLFLVVNNSDKIVVINNSDWKTVGTIHIPKPRYILPVDDHKAYVSTLYSNKVFIINTDNYTVTDTITLPNQNPEGMYYYNYQAFICTWDTAGNNIYKIDVTTDKVVQTIPVAGYAPQEIVQDKEQMLWVLAGNQTYGKTATFTRINPLNGAIITSYTFAAAANPMKPVMNPTKDTIYFIEADYNGGTANNGIYRMGIHDAALPAIPFVAAQQYQYFWGLGIDPLTGMILVGDPKGFTQKGSVYYYKPDGTKTASFTVGVGPGHFYFEP